MISRIFSERLENSCYPLEDSLVYPKGLLIGASLTLNEHCTVFLDTVSITDDTTSVLLSIVNSAGDKLLAYGSVDTGKADTIDILLEDTGVTVGFVILGSLATEPAIYSGSVQLLRSCVHIVKNPQQYIIINGNGYIMPSELNILISGYLDIENGRVYNKFPESGSLLDSASIITDGGINSVNGVVGRESIIIDMPTNQESTVPLFTANVDNHTDKYITITIGTNPEARREHISVFTCPDSDILLDKITGEVLDIGDVEAPLDTFVAWYKEQDYMESDSGI